MVWRGTDWHCMAGGVRRGMARCGKVGFGVAQQGRHGSIRHGVVGRGRHRGEWRGVFGLGGVWRSKARNSRHPFIFNKEKTMNEERKYLEQMARQNNGVLMIDDVLQVAQDENNILHRHFEWDDSEAAKQFRREQARSLIQRCKITILDSTPTHVRAFISLPSDRESGGGYRMTANVLGNEDMKEEFIHDIQLTIARWTKKLHLIDIDLAKLIVQLDTELKHRQFKEEAEARI
jgi:hypothetical protein